MNKNEGNIGLEYFFQNDNNKKVSSWDKVENIIIITCNNNLKVYYKDKTYFPYKFIIKSFVSLIALL